MTPIARRLATALLLLPLGGCAAVVLGVPINFVTTEILPRAVNGKGLAEDGADLVTGKDCRLVEGVTRKDRKVCETRGSPETKKDFKGLSGLGGGGKPAAGGAAPPPEQAAIGGP